jgi:hypothetical protein
LLAALLPRHLENDFQFDRGAERKAGDAVYQTARVLVFSEDVLQQLRSGVSDFRLIANISRSGHRDAEPDDPRHSVKRSQMVPRNSEDVERREVSRFAARFYIEFRADSSNECRAPAFRGKHPGQKKQIASLHSFRVCTEWLRWCRKLDTKFSQPQFGAGGPRAFARYHFVNVRNVHGQHLPGHMTGLNPLIRDFWVRGISIEWDMLFSEMPRRVAGRAPLRTRTTLATRKKEFTFQALV